MHRPLIPLLLSVVLSLSACGWRLQGTSKLSATMAATYIETDDRYTDFNRALRDSSARFGRRRSRVRSSDATAIVRIMHDESGQRVLSVSAAEYA